MSEDHDDCEISDQNKVTSDANGATNATDEEKCSKEGNEKGSELPEVEGSDVTKDEEVSVGAKETGKLEWELDGLKCRIKWNLPEGSTSPKDYIALCYAG